MTRPVRRHDLAYLTAAGWRQVGAAHPDLADTPVTRLWVERGWPLIGRRALLGEAAGATLGWPLPPSSARRRVAVLVPSGAVSRTMPPLALAEAMPAAPPGWHPTLARIDALVTRHGATARVYGSLALQAITGLDYLTDRSDLDLLVVVRQDTDLRALAAALGAVATTAAMPIDGEIAGPSGAAVKWRELLTADGPLLVWTSDSLHLARAEQLFSLEVPA